MKSRLLSRSTQKVVTECGEKAPINSDWLLKKHARARTAIAHDLVESVVNVVEAKTLKSKFTLVGECVAGFQCLMRPTGFIA